MIQEEKREAALKALQRVILRGREMAYAKAPHREIASLLDAAEYLPALLYDSSDMTDSYREYVRDISKEFSCESAIETLDKAWPQDTSSLDSAEPPSDEET